MCLLTVFARYDHWKWPNLAKMSKNSGFSKHGHIRESKYPLESGGGWGLFVFHKYFLVLKVSLRIDRYINRAPLYNFALETLFNFIFNSLSPVKTRGYRVELVRLSVRLSVRPSVRPSVPLDIGYFVHASLV